MKSHNFKKSKGAKKMKLTKNDLIKMTPGEIFERGIFNDSPKGINFSGTNNDVRWLAKRGEVEDWVIYVQNPHYGNLEWGYGRIENYGDKLFNPESIQKLIQASPDAMALYRY